MELRKGLLAALIGAAIAIAAPFVSSWEGQRFVAYQDSGGVWTLCEGHTRGVKRGDTATKEQCNAWRREDLEIAADAVVRCGSPSLPTNQLAAWISFTFNVGGDAFCRSTAAKLIRQGDYEGACNQIPRWVYVGSLDCREKSNGCFGIVRRRMAEYSLCWPDFSGVIGGVS